MKRLLFAIALVGASASVRARAQAEPLVEVSIAPWAAHDGVDRPYRYIVEMRARTSEVEVVADHRLVRFELRDGRRVHRCAHPAAPSRVVAGRARPLGVDGADEERVWREWVDLRMYCAGPALEALNRGAELAVRYGWPTRGRDRWIARRSRAPSREWTQIVELAPISSPPALTRPTHGTARTDAGPAALDAELAPATARTADSLTLRVTIRAREGSYRIFARPDFWSFRVRGPLGDVTCEGPSEGGPPAPELFRRVTQRGPIRAVLDPSYFCPPGTFELEGVYDITPRVRLPEGGVEWRLSAVTGRLVGPPATIRISQGERGYVEQTPEREAGRAD